MSRRFRRIRLKRARGSDARDAHARERTAERRGFRRAKRFQPLARPRREPTALEKIPVARRSRWRRRVERIRVERIRGFEGSRTRASSAGPAHRAGERAHRAPRVSRLDHHRRDVVQRSRLRGRLAPGRGVRASPRGRSRVGVGRVGARTRIRDVARARRRDRRPLVELAVRRVRGRRASRVATHRARRRRGGGAARGNSRR